MGRDNKDGSGRRAGIRLNSINIVMICIGLVLATLMVVSMYRTTVSVSGIVSFTNNYLASQQTGGMLRDFAGDLSEQAIAFVQSGEVGPSKSYEGQLNTINAQLAQYDPDSSNSAAANTEFNTAVEAFRARNGLRSYLEKEGFSL